MPRLFPIFKRAGGGTTDISANIGGVDEALSNISMELSPQDVGDVAEALGVSQFTLRTPVGSAGEVLTPSLSEGDAFTLMGANNDVLTAIAAGTMPTVPMGGVDSGGFTANSTVNAQQWGSSASQSGTDWANPGNVPGKNAGTVARIEAANSALAGDSYSSIMTVLGYGTPTEPVGWTRSAVNLLVHQRWKTNVNALDLLSTLSHSLELRNSGGLVATLATWGRGTADVTVLQTSSYPVSDADFNASDRLAFDAQCNLAIGTVLTSTVYWEVAWAAIELTYTRTGIT